jgi:CheY-like chemotaxis protein
MNTPGSKTRILYIEDDHEDVELLTHVLQHIKFNVELVHVTDGVTALDYLDKSRHKGGMMPDLIFLDINLSKLNGKETFVCLQADKEVARIPVVVLSTSNLDLDKNYFRKYQVPYIVKPGDINRFKEDLYQVLSGYLVLDVDFTQQKRKYA